LDDLYSHVKFYLVTDPALIGDRKSGTLELFDKDKPVKILEGQFSEKKVHPWLATHAFPLVSSEEQARARAKILSKHDLLVVYVKPGEDTQTVLEWAAGIASANKDLIVGSSVDPNAPDKQGASGKVFPTAVFTHKKKTYIWDEEYETAMTEESLNNFVASSKAGTYNSYIKSEPIPAENDGPGTVLDGKTIEEIAFDKEKDVLVEFYAPWCGHCKKLEPVYNELGTAFKEDPNVVIAKMDATANKVPSKFAVQGFPTIIFVPADKGGKASAPIPYKGDRTLEAFTSWIELNRVSKAAAQKVDL
jgi:protein disulfide isomerase